MLLKHFQKYYLSICFAGTVSGMLEPIPNESDDCTILIIAVPVIY